MGNRKDDDGSYLKKKYELTVSNLHDVMCVKYECMYVRTYIFFYFSLSRRYKGRKCIIALLT